MPKVYLPLIPSLFCLLWVQGAIGLHSLAAATIYEDDFNRGTSGAPVQLNGTSPTVGGGTWTSRTTGPAAVTNGAALSSLYSSTSSLAFNPVAGQIYTLSAQVSFSSTSTTSNSFAGIGFFHTGVDDNTTNTADVYSNLGENTPWMFLRGGNSTTTMIGDLSIRPLGNSGVIAPDTNLNPTSPTLLTLVLNTTAAQWTLDAFYNGIQWDLNGGGAGMTFTYSAVQSATLASTITHVGLTNFGNGAITASWDHFSLTAVPEPTRSLLLGIGFGMLLWRRQRAGTLGV